MDRIATIFCIDEISIIIEKYITLDWYSEKMCKFIAHRKFKAHKRKKGDNQKEKYEILEDDQML